MQYILIYAEHTTQAGRRAWDHEDRADEAISPDGEYSDDVIVEEATMDRAEELRAQAAAESARRPGADVSWLRKVTRTISKSFAT